MRAPIQQQGHDETQADSDLHLDNAIKDICGHIDKVILGLESGQAWCVLDSVNDHIKPLIAKHWKKAPWRKRPKFTDEEERFCAAFFHGGEKPEVNAMVSHIREAGNGDAEAGYRKLAKQLHPDRGGTHEQMAALNDAMTQIRSERVA